MNKNLIILALETLKEQCLNNNIWSNLSDNKKRIKDIGEQIELLNNNTFLSLDEVKKIIS